MPHAIIWWKGLRAWRNRCRQEFLSGVRGTGRDDGSPHLASTDETDAPTAPPRPWGGRRAGAGKEAEDAIDLEAPIASW